MPSAEAGSVLTVGSVVDAVIARSSAAAAVAPATLIEFADVMRRFARFCEDGLGIIDIADVDERAVGSFVASLRSDGRSPSLSQQHNRRTVCRFLFRAAQELDLVAADPTRWIALPRRPRMTPRPLTDDEVARCRTFAGHRPEDLVHPVAWALAEATATTHEIAQALVSDVDLKAGAVLLRGSARTNARKVAFTAWALDQVENRLQGSRDLRAALVPFRSRKVPRSSASMAVIETLRRAGVHGSDVRPISVALWRGARAHREGMPIEEVARLLGIPSLDRVAALIATKGCSP